MADLETKPTVEMPIFLPTVAILATTPRLTQRADVTMLAERVDPISNWVVVQALKMKGPGARTWEPALQIVRERGWEGWLQGGPESQQAMAQLRAFFGPRYHEAQEGFSLGWV